jgi:hypothetical protein
MVNSVTGTRERDRSIAVRFGDDPKAANHLRIKPGWTYVVRLCSPRAPVLAGSRPLPEPMPTTHRVASSRGVSRGALATGLVECHDGP